MSAQPLPKKFVHVLGKQMAFFEDGEGIPILFLHGNPTSSFLWRDVIAELKGQGRLIAPDLIGMGDSEKMRSPGPDTYRFATHRKFVEGFIDAVIGPAEKVLLVLHDWGSALGFDWANNHRERILGVAYMEGIVRPLADWSEWNPSASSIFQGFRSEKGEAMILDRNLFVERVLPGSVIRALSDAEMAEYRKPFAAREDRWPTLTWPREIPICGDPADVTTIVDAYAQWMARNELPKLFVNAEPGAILVGPVREFCRSWKNQTEATVAGTHFIQEDSGATIGRIIGAWMGTKVLPAKLGKHHIP